MLEMKSLTLADADFWGDKAGLVLIPRGCSLTWESPCVKLQLSAAPAYLCT